MDFVVKDGSEVMQLLQVCWNPNEYRAKERETKALLKASKELNCENLLVITGGAEREEIIGGRKIRFVPLWRWLLGRQASFLMKRQ